MTRFKYIALLLYDVSWFKTLFINLKLFGLSKIAFKLPILVFKNTEININVMGGGIKLDCNPTFGMIRIGAFRNNIYSKKNDYTKFSIDGKIIFHGRATFYSGSRIIVQNNGLLDIGKDFQIGSQTSIIAVKKIVFANNVMISWDNLIMDSDLHSIYNNMGKVVNQHREIYIGNNVWIGCRCCILKGAYIPDGNIISATTLITKQLTVENSIITTDRILYGDIFWNRKLFNK